MSEYQYYEFLAIDRPLDDGEQAEIRSLSTRARISATSFVNEYHWGDFKGDPHRLMERYYDAHLYVANWGSHRVMVRLPCDLLDPDVVEDYCAGAGASAWVTGDFLVLDFTSEDNAGEFDFDYDPQSLLSAIIGVRAELAAGDFRPLYLAWLAAYGAWERDEDVFDREADAEVEPPVPPGLGALTAAQRALADFLRLDDDLLTTAAEASPPLEDTADDAGDLASWVTRLPAAEKDRLLVRVLVGEGARVRMELLHRYRGDTAPANPRPARRTVADLLDAAARRRAERERRLARARAEDEAHREQARALARERRLDRLAEEGDTAWSRVDALIATRKPADYDAAVTLLTDLQALAEREDRDDVFVSRVDGLRKAHARKPSLVERLGRAGL
ncbi:hypothetical protein AMES_5534 [Amycolatopsis mediterranei S699]|uniref:Uncharacterized protein n=2 Tax=Amycolatopsis mediterranei TaxID=33910 RepID=A0A0H3DCJ9_AMYMU|nr:hypothetical protein [Amycolatopsis mediterranei]ADJ47359.1 conserved hypothetical protein [Amycolatopsis mediterranei U32]AEK44198.1 hypothetical protein RAM_28605 [Amycolatopsis mediterranei S699]AFO79070.1 hypothetical protein AMES_5534 [Amycolatopsis mediterranei S699]AGT86198.1 hypothetical protein B737_5534 [Amycolatopsis mediterranei RB]KDO12456.1 hypothetical protein DV26_02030 [Amycolatopsis mediterranei]